MKAALDGVIVLDASQLIAGPLAALYLADLGADVIKIEPPEGDKGRILGPVPVDDGRTTTFIAVNRNKRSVVLDLKSAQGQASLQVLLRRADVVITSARADSAKRLGLSPEAIRGSIRTSLLAQSPASAMRGRSRRSRRSTTQSKRAAASWR